MVQILLVSLGSFHPVADGTTHGRLMTAGTHPIFDLTLDLVGELGPSGGEQLYPVVVGGVV